MPMAHLARAEPLVKCQNMPNAQELTILDVVWQTVPLCLVEVCLQDVTPRWVAILAKDNAKLSRHVFILLAVNPLLEAAGNVSQANNIKTMSEHLNKTIGSIFIRARIYFYKTSAEHNE